MTRLLSELLGAREPAFGLHVAGLEAMAGRPSTDIRLSSEVLQASQAKLKALGLDPHDSTGRELYAALRSRLQANEAQLLKTLHKLSPGSDDSIAQVVFVLQQAVRSNKVFALKTASAKRLLKAQLPKKTMKLLGYRSAESFLKHEPPARLLAAAWAAETEQWHKKFLAGYGKLISTDFEMRPVTIDYPAAARWQKLVDSIVAGQKHNIASFKELGTVVVLPLPASRPELAVLTTAVLTLQAVNDISIAGTYLKLHQLEPDFGKTVQQVVSQEPHLQASLLERPLSWRLIQEYYGRVKAGVQADLFEPVVQAEDLVWHNVERILASIEPGLAFWHGAGHVAHATADGPVSYNLTDAVLSHCNSLPYESRITHHFKQRLTSELVLRYLQHNHVEQVLRGQLQKQFGQFMPEPAMVPVFTRA